MHVIEIRETVRTSKQELMRLIGRVWHRACPVQQSNAARANRAVVESASPPRASGSTDRRISPAMGLRRFLSRLSGKVTTSKHFDKYCRDVFNEVDNNASGTLDKTELHLVVMLFLNRVNANMRGQHVQAPKREEIFAIFEKVDKDRSGELSYEEFLVFMEELCKDMGTGVLIEWFKTLVVVPGIALGLTAGVKKAAPRVHAEMNSLNPGIAPALYAGAAGMLVEKLPPPLGTPKNP